jgi:hypothetical protein
MHHRSSVRFLAVLVLFACADQPPCAASFRWESGVSPSGECELSLSHDAVVTFDVPQPTSCSTPVVVPCGPGATCIRNCTTLTIVAGAIASKTIVDELGTSNPADVATALRCGDIGGNIEADVILETSSASLQLCGGS